MIHRHSTATSPTAEANRRTDRAHQLVTVLARWSVYRDHGLCVAIRNPRPLWRAIR